MAVASVELLLGQDWRAPCARSRPGLRDGLERPGDADVRVLGAIGVIEMDRTGRPAGGHRGTLEHGVWLRPFRNLVYAMPPYICTPEEIGGEHILPTEGRGPAEEYPTRRHLHLSLF